MRKKSELNNFSLFEWKEKLSKKCNVINLWRLHLTNRYWFQTTPVCQTLEFVYSPHCVCYRNSRLTRIDKSTLNLRAYKSSPVSWKGFQVRNWIKLDQDDWVSSDCVDLFHPGLALRFQVRSRSWVHSDNNGRDSDRFLVEIPWAVFRVQEAFLQLSELCEFVYLF